MAKKASSPVMDITFDIYGNPKIEVNGAVGGECLKLTKDLEAALGAVSEREEKPEMHRRKAPEVKQGRHQSQY